MGAGDVDDAGLGAGDADGTGDLDGDDEALLPGDGVPGDAGGDEAGSAAGAARVAATLGWNWADGCLTAPERAMLTAADAARTLATPVATSGRHQRRRDI